LLTNIKIEVLYQVNNEGLDENREPTIGNTVPANELLGCSCIFLPGILSIKDMKICTAEKTALREVVGDGDVGDLAKSLT